MTIAAIGMDLGEGAADMPASERIWLRRSGARPLVFDGWLLLEASNWDPDARCWHEVRIYELTDGRLAVAIGALLGDPGRADFWRAELVEGAEAAIELLRRFDPAADLPVELDLCDPRLTILALETMGREIAERIERTRTAYRRMLTTMLPT